MDSLVIELFTGGSRMVIYEIFIFLTLKRIYENYLFSKKKFSGSY